MNDLIHAAKSGNQDAFNALMLHYQGQAFRVAQQIMQTPMDAEDALQIAMTKVWLGLSRFEEGNFRSWFLRIVVNVCYDCLRRMKRHKALSLDELLETTNDGDSNGSLDPHHYWMMDATADVEGQLIREESLSKIMATIDNLSDSYRNVVLLVDVEGYDYAEAAAHLDIKLGTVKSRLNRGRNSVKERIVR